MALSIRPSAVTSPLSVEIPQLFGVNARGRVVFPTFNTARGQSRVDGALTLRPDTLPQFENTCRLFTEQAERDPMAWSRRRDHGRDTPDFINVHDVSAHRLFFMGADGTIVLLPLQKREWVPPDSRNAADAPVPLSVFFGLEWGNASSPVSTRLLLLQNADTMDHTIEGAQWMVSGPTERLWPALQRHRQQDLPMPENTLDSVLAVSALLMDSGTQFTARVEYEKRQRSFRTTTRRVHYSQVAQGAYRCDAPEEFVRISAREAQHELVTETGIHTIQLDDIGQWTPPIDDQYLFRTVSDVLVQGGGFAISGSLNHGTQSLWIAHLQRSRSMQYPPPQWLAACLS